MAQAGTAFELTPRGRLVAGLGLLAALAGWLGEDPHARCAAALLLAPVLLDLFCKPRHLHGMALHLPPRRTVVGAPFVERLVASPAGSWRGLRDLLVFEPRTMRGTGPACVGWLPSGKPTELLLPGRSDRRGHLLERVFVLSTCWPLGLWQARAVVTSRTDLITEPARVPLPHAVLPALGAEPRGAAELRSGRGAEFHALREHTFGDDARHVHALRSAGLGMLVQRVRDGREPREVGIVLDLRRPPGRPLAGGQRRLEWSLGATATLVEHGRRAGARVAVLVLDAHSEWRWVRTPGELQALLLLLAEAVAVPHRPLGPELFLALQRFAACWWVPAGSYLAAAEYAPFAAHVQLIDAEFD